MTRLRNNSQRDRVYKHLKRYGSITNHYAVYKMNIWRLASIINFLEDAGLIFIEDAGYTDLKKKVYKYVVSIPE